MIPYLLKPDLYYLQGLQCIFESWTDGQSGSVTQMGNGDNWHLDIQSIIFKIALPPIKWNHQNLLMPSKIRLSINLHKALNNQLDLVNQGRNKSTPLTFSLRSVSPWDCPVILVGGFPDLSIVLSCDRFRWTRRIYDSDLRYWTIGNWLVPGALEYLAGLWIRIYLQNVLCKISFILLHSCSPHVMRSSFTICQPHWLDAFDDYDSHQKCINPM